MSTDPLPGEAANEPWGDQNIERLLGRAYRPETPHPEFARRLEETLLATAREIAQSRVQTDSLEELRIRRLRWRLSWAMGVAAAVTGMVLILHARNYKSAQPVYSPDGLTERSDANRAAYPSFHAIGLEGLTARRLPPQTAARPLAVGETVRTGAGQRRRVPLPDGSILYVNQQTTVKLEGNRQVSLATGDVFVEVAHQDEKTGSPFTVSTAERKVTARGTKFEVRAGAAGTGVVVTQGKVEVSGFDGLLLAGQQLDPGAPTPTPTPRASHLLDWTKDLMAAALSPLVPESKYGGGALVAIDPSGQEAKLSLRKYHIDVHVEDGFARTTIDQTYFNHESWRLEGTFYFPLPPDASLSRLAMYVDGKLMEGGMAERDYARQVFEQIMYTRRDPALLEWVDGSTFKMRVFPLEGRQEKRIILSYTQRLPWLFGRTQYRFPAGHSLEVVRDWSFHARLKNAARVAWSCESHKLQETRDGSDLLLGAQERGIKVDRDLVLSLDERAEPSNRPNAAAGARFSSAEQEGARYLMVRYRPELHSQTQKQRRDWVFLFESSADRDPLLARTQVEIIRTLLANAEADDTFVLLTAGTRVHAFAEKPLLVTPANVKAAMEFLERSHLVGALDLGQALDALKPLLKIRLNPYLVHVGSGTAALGERRENELLKRIPAGLTYVGVGVGKRWARNFMKSAAEQTGGYFTQINPDEPVSWRAFDLISTLNTPRLLDIKIVDKTERVTFLNYTGSLAQGEELCAMARLESGAKDSVNAVTITGKLDGKPFSQVVPVKDVAGDADYLPRTWAKLEIDRLLAEDAQNNKDKIVALSKAMYVMTPFTSLLVLENEQMYKQFNVDRGRKDHWALYPCPEQIPVVYEPIGGSVDTRNAPRIGVDERPTREQLLQSILMRVPPRILQWPDELNNRLQSVTAWQLYSLPRHATNPYWLHPPGKININTINAFDDFDLFLEGYLEPPGPQRLFRLDSESALRLQDAEMGRLITRRTATPGQRPNLPNRGQSGLPSVIRPGMRAVALRVRSDSVFGGFVLPQSRVDIVSVLRRGDNETHSNIIMQNVLVLAVDTLGRTSDDWMPSTVTLEVTPQQAEKLALASELGTIRLNLRGFEDMTTLSTAGVSPSPLTEVLSSELILSGNSSRGLLAPHEWRGLPVFKRPPGQGNVFRPFGFIDHFTSNRPALSPYAALAGPGNLAFKYYGLVKPAQEYQQTMNQIQQQEVVSGLTPAGSLTQDLNIPISNSSFLLQSTIDFGLLLYQRPTLNKDERLFYDLVAFAPGMNTNRADILAVLEAEGPPNPDAERGKVDPQAAKLIAKARSVGWQELTIAGSDKQPDIRVVFDGTNRFVYDRVLPEGLQEHVACDDKTLLHLYPELGIGARRAVSRFHRVDFAELLPCIPLSAEDLARGHDLKCVNERTVAILPRSAGSARGTDGGPLNYTSIHLVFAKDGRLTERRLVEMPSGKVWLRETYGDRGSKLFDNEGKELASQAWTLRPALPPDLNPDTQKLVVLPLPYRSRECIERTFKQGLKSTYASLDGDDALALFGTTFAQGETKQALDVFRQCFESRGDKRVGFYTLLAGCGHHLSEYRGDLNLQPVHTREPLTKYLDYLDFCSTAKRSGQEKIGAIGAPGTGLLPRLAAFHDLLYRWDHAGVFLADESKRDQERKRALDFIRDSAPSWLGWAALSLVQERDVHVGLQSGLAEICTVYEHAPGLAYQAQYERGRCLLRSDQPNEARKTFLDLHAKTVKEGQLPAIDKDFLRAISSSSDKPNEPSQFLKQTAAALIADGRRPAVVALAWQFRQLGENSLADELVDTALAGMNEQELPLTRLLSIGYLWHAKQQRRAENLLESLLKDKRLAQVPSLWRMRAALAAHHGTESDLVPYFEKALDLEYQHLPERVDVHALRNDYTQLLTHYQKLADAMATVNVQPPTDFIAKVIRAADRWRSLDKEPSGACQAAAQVLSKLGIPEIAWDYLTTPIALHPNEASPCSGLAQTLSSRGDLLLADRAYTLAFEAEPTNAQILWDRALLLEQSGKTTQARPLFRRLAEGNWQPRFSGIQQEARRRLIGH